MRLLIVIPNIVSYRSFLSDLCAEKVRNGHEVHVACSTDEQWSHGITAPDQPGVRVHPIEFARGMHPLQHARAAGKLRRLVRTITPISSTRISPPPSSPPRSRARSTGR